MVVVWTTGVVVVWTTGVVVVTGTGFGVSVITTEWPPWPSATAAWVKAPAVAPSPTTTRPGSLVDLTATPLPDFVPPAVLMPPCQSSTDVLPPEMAVLLTMRPDFGRLPPAIGTVTTTFPLDETIFGASACRAITFAVSGGSFDDDPSAPVFASRRVTVPAVAFTT